MTFISYSKNQEDFLLWRALRDCGPGFYIDIGAQDAVSDSATKGFYNMGWRGINVEPVKEHFEKIQHERSRDINLNIAIGAENGTTTHYRIKKSEGVSTLMSDYVQKYLATYSNLEKIEVPLKTLAEICEAHVDQEIHFLKIDVEGAEKAVLEGADFKRHRPWILLIRSIEPGSTDPAFAAWEPLLLNAEYSFVHFDGQYRFYLSNEKFNLLSQHFIMPPNSFDGYEKFSRIVLENALNAAHNEKNILNQRMSEAETKYVEIVNSFWWKITLPARLFGSRIPLRFRRIMRRGIKLTGNIFTRLKKR